ncbi:MAG: hypothetical protein ACU84J_02415 [Gammaproteobacteria bacterium]
MADTKVVRLGQGNRLIGAKSGRKLIGFTGGILVVLSLIFAGYRQGWIQPVRQGIESHTVKALNDPPERLVDKSADKMVVFKRPAANSAVKKTIRERKIEPSPLSTPSRVVFADELITQLFDLKQREDLYPDEIESRIKSILQRLIYQGEEAIPAIQDYLKTLEDITYAERKVDDRVVDSKSLRISLYEVLDQIGGIEAIDVLAGELQSTRTPLEIATLSEILDRQAPEEFRKASLSAAKTAYLSMAEGELKRTDAAPLFHVLGRYGNADIAEELQELQSDASSDWRLYATVALADIPEGEGVNAIIKSPLLNEPRSHEYQVPVRMLAQLAGENSEAQQALMSQVQEGKIPDRLWPYLAGALTGTKEYQLMKPHVEILSTELTASPYPHHIFGGKQSQKLYIVDRSGDLSTEQVEARIAVIDLLLEETASKTAINTLQQARESLAAKLPYE